MIIKLLTKKIGIIISAILVAVLLYMFPQNEKDNSSNNLIDNPLNTFLFLVDEYDYVTKVAMSITEKDIINQAKEILKLLTVGNEYLLPKNFQPIIPKDTKILAIDYKENLLKINFSKELLNISEIDEEKMIEAIVYSLTEIKNVDNIMIFIEDELLTKYPHSGNYLNTILNRKIGINKEYDITSLKDNEMVTIYYLSIADDMKYYTPISKIISGEKEKIEIIIEELQSTKTINTNLKSYLATNAKLEKYEILEDVISLSFNHNLFKNKELIEEISYTIGLSILDNYNIANVTYMVNDSFIKTVKLENT